MSANYSYSSTFKRKELPLNSKATFKKAMHKCFGEAPWSLTKEDLDTLKGMQAAMEEDEAFEKIIKSVEGAESTTIDYSN